MIWIALRFMTLTLWLFPIYRGCQRRQQGDRPWLFVLLLAAMTGLWLALAPPNGWSLLLSWLMLPWLSWGLVKAAR